MRSQSTRNLIYLLAQGDWAGADYPTSGCPGDCVDCRCLCRRERMCMLTDSGLALAVVDNNPAAFANAYWEINSLRVYTPI